MKGDGLPCSAPAFDSSSLPSSPSGWGGRRGMRFANCRFLQRLPRILRDNRFAVTATVGRRRDIAEIMDIEGGNTADRNYIAVVDVGTSTVVVHLVNVVDMTTVDAQACFNSQSVYGREVTARIMVAEKKGAAPLQEAIVRDINQLISTLATRNGIGLRDITAAVCAGNTTMMHLLLGLPARNIRRAPCMRGCCSWQLSCGLGSYE